MQQQGDKLFASFMASTGGLNTADSTFAVDDSQAVGGYNYDYVKAGGFQKSLCPSQLNATPDSQLRSFGFGLRNPKSGTKSIIRAAGTKLQLTNLIGTFTNLSEDTAAVASSFIPSTNTTPVVSSMFVTPTTDVLWLAGGGMSTIYGAYSDSKVTAIGAAAPTGALALTEVAGGGVWASAGTYYYAVAFHKASTGALSNAALDLSITTVASGNSVKVDLSGITNLDATKYDKIYLYRSTLNGASSFTTGDLVAQIAAGTTTYTDTGSSLASAQNIPRAGNTILDNSVLPSGTYSTIATWKRRLVTTTGSTVYISDLNKPESFPSTNVLTVPSGGPITGLAVISFTPNAASTDEFLAVFKETEVWIITGSSFSDWSLKFVDYAGSMNQAGIASANGFLYFLDNRGVYVWDGIGKPIYLSRPIENYWGTDGKLDRSQLSVASAVFFKRQNQIIWFLSNTDLPTQTFLLKLDLRLTLPMIKGPLAERILDGVFIFGKVNNPVYAAACFLYPTASNQEIVLITGDAAGHTYRQFYAPAGVGAADYDFTYETKHHDLASPNITKQFYQVIVWVENVGNWPLYLDYWTQFRSDSSSQATTPVTIDSSSGAGTALWDIGQWDVASWDGYTSRPKRLVFNLASSPANNNQGEVIKLRFRNQNASQPVTIYGYGISYQNLATRT